MAQEPTKKKQRDAAALYKRVVCDQAAEIDPSDKRDWFSLSLGFFMGQGLTIDEAHDLSLWVRYETGNFQDEKWKDWTP